MFKRTKLDFKMEIEFLQLKIGDEVISRSLYSFKIDFYILASDIFSALLGKGLKLQLVRNTVVLQS